MKLSDKAKRLLLRIGDTKDASLRLTRGNKDSAQELIGAKLAILIYKARGGADVCLNKEGLEEYESIK